MLVKLYMVHVLPVMESMPRVMLPGRTALAGQNDWYLITQLNNFVAGYRADTKMIDTVNRCSAMVGHLTDEAAIRDVVAYIISLVIL